MQEFKVVPKIIKCENVEEFCKTFSVGKGDLLFISEGVYKKYFQGKTEGALVVHYRKYGLGEPTDVMAERIYEDVKKLKYKRVIAVGGGTILDLAKLFALKRVSPILDLYDKKIEIKKEKELILIPTTCGTGSEVTNISILNLIARNTKQGLAVDELYADAGVLIPELLRELPFCYFVSSSADALIHGMESFTSPKANAITRVFSLEAIKIILNGYQKIVREGQEARLEILDDMLLASTYAGIAFGNAGCGAVHAMSYPLGSVYHVPHGEANYAIFLGVYKTYQKMKPNGSIQILNEYLSKILNCEESQVYDKLEELLNQIIKKKPLRQYGMCEEEIELFSHIVIETQERLLANSYIDLGKDGIRTIYQQLF